MKKERLTARQLEFLRLLLQYRRKEGIPPTVREMREYGGFSSTRSVLQFLDALEKAGYIRRGHGARNVRIVKVPLDADLEGRVETVPIPLIGTVAAGSPILAEENVEAQILVSKSLARGPHTYFLLRVQGDSMNRAGINNGDLVLVRQQQTAENGEKVVALIDDKATVKELHVSRDAVVLHPRSSNKKHKPIILQRDVLIQGVVIATIPNQEGES